MYSGGSEAFQGGFFARSLGKVGPVVRPSTPRMVASPPKIDQVEVAPGYKTPGSGQVKRTVDPYNPDFHEVASFGDAYPESTKEYKEIVHAETGHKMRVPFRRIHLSDPDPGCSHLDVYDTAGPLGADPKKGLPSVRGEWIKRREDSGDEVFTQMHYAKQGIITEEMAYCAAREGMDPEFVRWDSSTQYSQYLDLAFLHVATTMYSVVLRFLSIPVSGRRSLAIHRRISLPPVGRVKPVKRNNRLVISGHPLGTIRPVRVGH